MTQRKTIAIHHRATSQGFIFLILFLQNANPSANEIESLINEEIAKVKEWLNEWRKDLDNLPKEFRKFEQVAASLKEFKKTCNHWTYYDNELRYMTIQERGQKR